MIYQKLFNLSIIFLLISLCSSAEYNILINAQNNYSIKDTYWKNNNGNSTIEIENIQIDIINWRIIAENKESFNIKINNPIWESAGYTNKKLDLPNIIEISEKTTFRGTPFFYIQITPWQIKDGNIYTLISAEVQIFSESKYFFSDYNKSYVLNKIKSHTEKSFQNDLQYLIICSNRFANAAQSLANMHSDSVQAIHQLNTKVKFVEEIGQNNYEIRNYILEQIENNNNLEYLLLLGDENDIPPIFNGDYPSDDFYSTNDAFFGDPQLITGRIPVSNQNDAMEIINKIKKYSLHSTPGIWKSKLTLIADDMHKSCAYNSNEKSHTTNTDRIYDSLKTLLSIQPFYSVNYPLQQTNGGCEYPNLTSKLIRTINNGTAIINYIGHGSPDTWSGEKLLTMSRDLSRIQVKNNKLAVWIAGTCSFGQYIGEDSFMEELLLKQDGAIAVVATTDVIGYTANSTYLNNLFGLYNNEGLQTMLKDNDPIRLGRLVTQAKNGNYHKFHTFGDPALILPLPKFSNNIIDDIPNPIHIVEEQSIILKTMSNNSTILIQDSDQESIYVSNYDSIYFTTPGEILTKMTSELKEICFRIPIDANICDNCAQVKIYQENAIDEYNYLQSVKNISIISNAMDFNDKMGPEIKITQDNNKISNGSAILINNNLQVTLIDTSGINLMETIGHGIQYKFDNENLTQISGNEFIYSNCDSGTVNIPISLNLNSGIHTFYFEAWDGVNNKSSIEYNLDIIKYSSISNNLIDKVFPIPNPFSDYTEFTMIISNPPVEITITIYSIIGDKVIDLGPYIAENIFTSILWDGKDKYGRDIANGAYFYHLEAKRNGTIIFENIYKLAKIK